MTFDEVLLQINKFTMNKGSEAQHKGIHCRDVLLVSNLFNHWFNTFCWWVKRRQKVLCAL